MAGDPHPRAGVSQCPSHSGTPPYSERAHQFRVLRSKGTEAPGTGGYEHHKALGIYSCAGCNTPLYKSTTKFDSGCGWPAFFDGNNDSLRDVWSRHVDCIFMPAIPGAVSRHVDRTLGRERTEITCTACGGHLGHVFKGEGYKTPSKYPAHRFLPLATIH
jgi:peptide methionine sulfoxide reductase MsrB